MKADYIILAVPVTTLRAIDIRPGLPLEQTNAFSRLKYGRVTKSLRGLEPAILAQEGTTDGLWH